MLVRPGEVRLTIHAPLPTTGVARDQVIDFTERVREIVRADV
jgi:hypothetical protein